MVKGGGNATHARTAARQRHRAQNANPRNERRAAQRAMRVSDMSGAR